MLTSLRIRHFKAWGDTGPIRLAPLTVIFGANSAGKSSLGQLLLALKQTVLSSDRRRVLHLGDEHALIDLGSFVEVLHNHDLRQPLGFELGWRQPLTVRDPLSSAAFVGDELRLAVELLADRHARPQVGQLSYQLRQGGEATLTVNYTRTADGAYTLHAEPLRLQRLLGHDGPLPPPDKFYRVPDEARAQYRNADFLADLALAAEAVLGGIQHLGPLREPPRRLYAWTGEAPENVGARGELTIPAILAASEQERMFGDGEGEPLRLDAYLARWLKRLELIESFAVRPIAPGRHEYEVLIRTHPAGSEVKLTDVGFGVSQLLPVLTQAFYGPPGATVWLEQPEVHLHPRVQAELADVFIAAVQARENGRPRHAQLVVESHSEHFLNRIQRRVAEGTLAAEDVAVYFCRRGESHTELEPLRLNEYGEIENWPEHFFGDEMADIAARTLAALRRRKNAAGPKP